MSAAKSKDSVYFTGAKKGEIHELKQDLDSSDITAKKDALKKIIASMTVGKDVSMLFFDVVKNIQTTDLELKKLVYLYVMNYAKTQPDLAILSVNAFVQDSTRNPNPLIRALAIRTMGCIRVEKITEYLAQPLHQCLKDPDPYVRKTAAVCVAKLYDIAPDLVESQGFIDKLVDLLSDSFPIVVANAIAALSDINEASPGRPLFKVDSQSLTKLLAALNECTEWGQCFILNALATYQTTDPREAESISERVTARLQHSNPAVVLGAIRVIMVFLDHIQNEDVVRSLCKKLGPPLVTLLSKEPEIQYVALRNISLILQKRPTILQNEMRVFFCKYNDPIYVKMEKLEIMNMLASDRTIDQVLLELKEYATGADVEFVRKSVRAIGRCAVKLNSAAERCIHVLLELIEQGFNPVIQEAIIVIKDIFRKYPNQYESIIGKLCEKLDTLDEPEAKASMIWILGEYAERIENADDLIDHFLESFLDELPLVQLQLLTATVKLFLKRPKNTKDMVLKVLNTATQEVANPDIRDRGFIYWRLLTDPKSAKAVVLGGRPLISDDTNMMDPRMLDELIANISTLASVYHKPADAFVPRASLRRRFIENFGAQESEAGGEVLVQDDAPAAAPAAGSKTPVQQQNLLDIGISSPVSTSPSAAGAASQLASSPAAAAAGGSKDWLVEKKLLLPAESGNGLEIRGAFIRKSGSLFVSLTFTNRAPVPITDLAIQFNRNIFGLAPGARLQVPPLQQGQAADVELPLSFSGIKPPPETPPTNAVQIAIKVNNGKIVCFQDAFPFDILFESSGPTERQFFLQTWKSLPEQNEVQKEISNLRVDAFDQVVRLLQANNIFLVEKILSGDRFVLYLSVKLKDTVLLVELTILPNSHKAICCVKSTNLQYATLFFPSIERLLVQ